MLFIMVTRDSLTCTCLSISGGSAPVCASSLDLDQREASERKSERMNKEVLLLLLLPPSSRYLSAPMLPTTMTAAMMPMRLYLGKVLDSCLRITMCMSSWGEELGQ